MESFVRAWKQQFPGSEPPQYLIQCLKNGDLADYRQVLDNSSIRINELQRELHHQEFISSRFRELIDKENDIEKHQNKISPDDPLDRQVPLLSSTDTLASEHSYTEVAYDNISSLSSPDSNPELPERQIYVNDSATVNHESFKHDFRPPPPKPVPAPRNSTKLSFNIAQERSSVFMMENISKQNCDVNVSIDKRVARGGSLDSSYAKPGKKAPDPPAKPTKISIKKFRKDSNDMTDMQIVKSASANFSHKGSNASLNKSPSEESCVEITISPKPDANISPGYDKTTVPMSTFKPQNNISKPMTSSFSPKLQRRVSPVVEKCSNTSPSLLRKPSKHQHRKQESDSIYDEPIPVKEDQVEEDASSSDEEPVYYNLMLLKKKQQSMDARLTYGTLDLHKLKLERDAKNLSCRFSLQPESHMRNVKHVKPPMMKPLKSNRPKTFVRGVTEEDSTTDQEPSGNGEDTNSVESAGDSLSSTGDRSGSVDSLASAGSTADEHSWKKRQSVLLATAEESAYSDDIDLDLVSYPEEDKIQMRRWVATSILDSEQSYVSMLDVLQQYRNSFRAAEKTSQSLISEEDTETIFFKIPELHRIHLTFITDLKPRVDKWTSHTQVADLYKVLAVEEFPIARDYLNNYQKAISCIHRCSQDQRFHDLTQNIKVVGVKEAPKLEELLHKPVVRFQRNTLVLHDLINCTPTSHPDYDLLQKTLKIAQNFLDNFQAPQGEREHGESSRYLARYSPIVEKIGNHRKLRHILLFNDMIVCSKQKISGRNKMHHEHKWSIPLLDLTLDDKVTDDEKIAQSHRENIEGMQRSVAEVQGELRNEMKKFKHPNEGQRSWSVRSSNKTIEKLRKRLLEKEAALVLQSPHLVFRLKNGKTSKNYTLLLSSDYERTNWKDTIAGLKGKVSGSVHISAMDIGTIINTVKLPKVATGTLLDDSLLMQDEHLFGMLHVTIHRLHGLKTKTDTYVCLELDSFSHFFMKAKTRINKGNKDPVWNEAFELDLEGAQTLRILCYSAKPGADILLGKCALELSKAWLRGDFQEKTVPFNDEMSISVSLRYASRDANMRRRQSAVKGGVFGQRIDKVTGLEGSHIPIPVVVTACVQEVEARGLDEVGIYRVSGLSSDIDQLKKAFDKSSRSAVQLAHDMDIHVLASLLKLYFRELPEGLLTTKAYGQFVKGMSLTDPEAKEKYMISLMKSLPGPNQATAIYMLDHMLKICSYSSENKMTLQNLATVFGPTLLRPVIKKDAPISIEMFSENAKEAMMQTGVLLYLLQLKQGGWDLDTKL